MKPTLKSIIMLILLMLLVFAIVSCSNTAPPNTFIVKYVAMEGGYINGDDNQMVEKGANAKPVTAIPNDGYVFVDWSDGRKDNTRQETNIISNLNIYANFSKYYIVAYGSTMGGNIDGNLNQTILNKQDAEAVTAMADPGYTFIKWSDGVRHKT